MADSPVLYIDMGSNQAVRSLRRYGKALLAEEGAHLALDEPTSMRSGWRSLQFALPTAVLLLIGNIGLAAAADNAIPGDLLYPVDRAYERLADVLGIDTDPAAERLSEASVLLVEGRFDSAVEAIAASVENPGSAVDGLIIDTAADLASTDTTNVDREDLHRSVAALGSTVAALNASGDDPVAWIETIDASSQAVSDVAAGLPFAPEGQGDNFTPPGQDDEFTPPGQEGGSLPPGQDEDRTPPGQDEDRTPPGQEDGSLPPGQDEDRTPPGQDEDRTPPGQDEDRTPPGQGDKDKGNEK